MRTEMTLGVTRWPGPGTATDGAILELYAAEGLSPYRWGNGPGDRYATHSHNYNKVLYCSQGSITFIAAGDPVHLEAGDRLDLPAGTPHSAIVGPKGCSCYEAHC